MSSTLSSRIISQRPLFTSWRICMAILFVIVYYFGVSCMLLFHEKMFVALRPLLASVPPFSCLVLSPPHAHHFIISL